MKIEDISMSEKCEMCLLNKEPMFLPIKRKQ